MKLTKPQLDLLTRAVAAGRATCWDGYPPAKKLISLGYATQREGRWGSYCIEPTDAGRKALARKTT